MKQYRVNETLTPEELRYTYALLCDDDNPLVNKLREELGRAVDRLNDDEMEVQPAQPVAQWVPSANLTRRATSEGTELSVEVTWYGPEPLDRPSVGGWVFSANQWSLAERLTRAINAGVVYKNPTLKMDVNGKTYIDANTTQFFHKRHMDKSLRAVGF